MLESTEVPEWRNFHGGRESGEAENAHFSMNMEAIELKLGQSTR